jgi:hypothetical protein
MARRADMVSFNDWIIRHTYFDECAEIVVKETICVWYPFNEFILIKVRFLTCTSFLAAGEKVNLNQDKFVKELPVMN